MVVVAMAVAQLLVQFSYFLEIGRRSGAWRLITLALAVTTAVIVFGGSLWIMANLGHTPPNERFNGTPSPQSQVD